MEEYTPIILDKIGKCNYPNAHVMKLKFVIDVQNLKTCIPFRTNLYVKNAYKIVLTNYIFVIVYNGGVSWIFLHAGTGRNMCACARPCSLKINAASAGGNFSPAQLSKTEGSSMRKTLFAIWKQNWFVCSLALLAALAVGLMTPLTVRCEERLINGITQILGGGTPVSAIIFPLLQLTGIYICIYILPSLASLLYEKIRMASDLSFRQGLMDKMQTISYQCAESREVMELYSRIHKGLDSSLQRLVPNVCDLIASLIGVAGFFAVICSVSLASAGVFLALFVVMLVFADYSAKSFFRLDKQFTDTERRVVYLDSVENTRPFAHEKKLFGFTDYINEKRSGFLMGQRNAQRRYDYKFGLTFSLIDTAGYICTILLMLTMLGYILDGRITPGLFIAASHAAVNLNLTTQNRIRDIINELMRQKRFWKEYESFLALPDQDRTEFTAPAPGGSGSAAFESLEFCDVSFQYPNGPKVLDHISFKMENGKHYALVGENGAGKSTIIKLLLRLYEVNEGDILLNGRSIRQYSQGELYRIYAAVFQDFSRYYVSFRDNITFGRPPEEARMGQVLQDANLSEKMDRLPDGMDTMLGEIYQNGVNLSGGEWQRIAFARALYQDSPVILLDEPTSALDPIAENAIYEQFGRIAQGKTTLFITHRLASTRLADEIFVLSGGKIAESGSHAALMDQHGLYEKMFDSQKKWYAEEGAI